MGDQQKEKQKPHESRKVAISSISLDLDAKAKVIHTLFGRGIIASSSFFVFFPLFTENFTPLANVSFEYPARVDVCVCARCVNAPRLAVSHQFSICF